MPSLIRSATLAVAGLALTLPLAAQQAPRSLPAPEADYEEPFSSIPIGALRELSNGRVIVADPRDKLLQAIDFRTGAATTIGREGSGPQEFGMPFRLLLAPSDTTYLYDILNTRFLVIGPDAKPINTFRVEIESGPSGPGGMRIGGGLNVRSSDARGRLYGEGSPITMGADGRPTSADSVPLMRYDRNTKRVDTLSYIRLPESNSQVSGGQGNMRVMIGGANPLAPRDEWAVFPDGRVAIVRASDYHVDWVMPDGTKRSSPAIRYTPIRMTAAEIRHEEEQRNVARASQMSVMVTDGPGGRQASAQMGPPPGAPPLQPLDNWPEVKPPFRSGLASVVARPNGELWVRRTEDARARGTLYDVIDAQGRVAYQLRLAEGVTLVGFGNGTIYTTVKDEDDLVYLRRHRAAEMPVRGN